MEPTKHTPQDAHHFGSFKIFRPRSASNETPSSGLGFAIPSLHPSMEGPGDRPAVLATSDRDSSKNCCGTDQTGYDEFVGYRLEKLLSGDQIEKQRATSTDQRIDSLDWRNQNGPTSGSSGTANPPQKAHDPAILSSRFGPSKEGVRDSRARLTGKSIPPYSFILDHRKSRPITFHLTFPAKAGRL